MKSKRYLGIWMDHSVAHLMELTTTGTDSKIIEATSNLQGVDGNFNKDESRIHNKEQNHLAEYFKKLSDAIRDFDDVILFGPTDARVELMNILKQDHRFDSIKIATKATDKMTENQMLAYTRVYFREEEE